MIISLTQFDSTDHRSAKHLYLESGEISSIAEAHTADGYTYSSVTLKSGKEFQVREVAAAIVYIVNRA